MLEKGGRMEIYMYRIDFDDKFIFEKIGGFEEKEKTYMRKSGYPRQIKKSELGCVKNDFLRLQLFLLERDDKRAKDLFRLHLNQKLNDEKNRHEKECYKINSLLMTVNKKLKENESE